MLILNYLTKFILKNQLAILILLFLQATDANISFLRAARSGDKEKVIEFLESGQVADINTCNAVSTKLN